MYKNSRGETKVHLVVQLQIYLVYKIISATEWHTIKRIPRTPLMMHVLYSNKSILGCQRIFIEFDAIQRDRPLSVNKAIPIQKRPWTTALDCKHPIQQANVTKMPTKIAMDVAIASLDSNSHVKMIA